MAAFLLVMVSLLLQHTATAPAPAPARPDTAVVVLETEMGHIAIELDSRRAPVTVENFLKYVDAGLYDGGEFSRAVRPDNETRQDAPIQIVQFRIDQSRKADGFPPIPVERTGVTGLRHVHGTVSMARDVTPGRPGPNTATSDVFITIGAQPSLDDTGNRSPDGQGFAAFGKVISGMDVVLAIQKSPTPKDTPATARAGRGQTLVPPVRIIRAYRK